MSTGGAENPGEHFLPTRLDIHPGAWIAPDAVVVGHVRLADEVSVWYGCVIRGDLEPIEIDEGTNVQDLTVIHVDRGVPTRIGRRVTIGHRSVIHGCVIEDDALIGMGSLVLSGSRIGKGALVAAGAVVLEGFEVPEGRVAMGVPARLGGEVDSAMQQRVRAGVATYVAGAAGYRQGLLGGGPHGAGDAWRRRIKDDGRR